MRIVSIELEGFRSWRDRARIDLDGAGMVAVVGPNRAGKTSLIAAVELALWGTTRGTSVKDVINRQAKSATVALEFTTDDGTFRVTRTRRRSGADDVAVCAADRQAPGGWRDLCETNRQAADPVITRIVGMDERTSALTWLVRQNEYDAFFAMEPTRRREALVAAFGLDRFARLAELAEQARSEADRLASRAQWAIDEAERSRATAQDFLDATEEDVAERQVALADRRFDEAQERLTAAQQAGRRAEELAARHALEMSAVQERRRELTARRDQAAAGAADAQARAEDAAAAGAALPVLAERLEQARADATRIEQRIGDLSEEATAVRAGLASAEANLAAMRTSRGDLDIRIAALSHAGAGSCAVCGSALDPHRADQLAKEARGDAAATDARIGQLEAELAAARTAGVQLAERQQRGRSRLAAARQAAEEAAAALASAQAAASGFDRAVDDAARRASDVAHAETQLAAVNDPVLDEAEMAALRVGADDLVRMAGERDRARDARDRAVRQLGDVHRAQEDLDAARARASQATAERDAHAQRAGDLTVVRDEFRPAGIPSRILDGIVAELNDDANAIMDATGDDGLHVEVSTTRQTAKGTTQDRVSVHAITPDGTRVDHSTLSGSEQFRCAVAIRLGQARCIARRTGTPVRTFVLDEGWGNLDAATRRQVAVMLARLSERFDVLTVSHIDDVKHKFDTVVAVEAVTGTSTAQVTTR